MRTRPRFPRGATIALALGALLLRPGAACALHKESPPAFRITQGGSHPHPLTRSWGSWFAFTASEDLANTGNTRQEIFYFNLAFFDCDEGTTFPTTPCPNPLGPFLVQITDSPGAPDNPSLATPFATGGTIIRIGSGNSKNNYLCQPASPTKPCTVTHWLAFDALGSFSGSTGPDAGHRQIFLKNLVSGEIRQVTHGTDGDSVRPNLDSTGGTIVFQSNAHLTLAPTPPGVDQVYVYEVAPRLLRLITSGAVPSTAPITNLDGGLIAFQSAANLLGNGADTGTSQIFWAEYDKLKHTATLHQLTDGNAPSEHPYISEVTSFIIFDSSATNLPGTLGHAGTAVFYTTPLKASTPQPPQFTQVTDPATFGDCSYPFVDAGSVEDHLGFICTGDPLQNGTTGNRVFVFERSTVTLEQITGRGDVQPPIGGNLGSWFVTMSTTDALTGQSGCGYQLYFIDYLGTQQPGHDPKWIPATQIGELPPDSVTAAPGTTTNLIGARNFVILPGATTTTLAAVTTTTTTTTGPTTTTLPVTPSSGNWISLTTRDGATVTPLDAGPVQGIHLVMGAPAEGTLQASISVPAARVSLPPIPDTDYGQICITSTSDGTGVIDCDGIDPGGDLLLTRDHNIDPLDPECLNGCREGAACQGDLIGPHQYPCPVCTNGVCSSGPNAGQACSADTNCAGNDECVNGMLGVCNGPLLPTEDGTFAAGGMQLTVPVKVGLSRAPGLDGKFCTDDDEWAFRDAPTMLHLTSGSLTTTVADADDVRGATLTASDAGAPFNCAALQAGAMRGAALVGAIPLFDVPQSAGIRDLILGLHLVPRPDDNTCEQGCTTNADCNDGNPCDGVATCSGGLCQPGTPINCNDNNPCTTDTCDPTTGTCTHTPCPAGNLCTGLETCTASGCQIGTPIVCTASNTCNGLLWTPATCDPTTGACLPGTSVNCDDGNPCTDDACDPTAGCSHTPNTAACDDGNACTTGDTCQGGLCIGTPVNCNDPNVCDGQAFCDPTTGACLPGTPLNCNDGNPCTTGTCDPTLGCLYTNNTNPCDDGNPCTANDTCTNGVCTGTPVVCAGNFCAGIGTCDPTTGLCGPGTPPTCDDGNPCTNDSCDTTLQACVHTPNTSPCDDGNPCTTGDVCAAGVCTGTPINCSDGNVCNGTETCDPTTGMCLPGTPLNCNSGNPCIVDSCDPVTGCMHVPNPNPTGCLAGVLAADVSQANPSQLGGTRRQATLEALIGRMQSALAAKHYAAADRGVVRLEKRVQRGMSRSHFDPTLSNSIIGIAQQLKGELKPLLG